MYTYVYCNIELFNGNNGLESWNQKKVGKSAKNALNSWYLSASKMDPWWMSPSTGIFMGCSRDIMRDVEKNQFPRSH